MAQKANLVSYREGLPSVLILLTKKKLFHFFLCFVKHFCQFLVLAQILLPKINIFFNKGICALRCLIFFKTSKIRFFLKNCYKLKKKRIKKKLNFLLKKKFLIKNSFFSLLIQNFVSYISNLYFFYYKIKNIHIFLKTALGQQLLSHLFFFFKSRGYKLFPRRFNFYMDMIKLSALFCLNKISSSFFLKMLGEIFKFLQKRQHAKFFVFLKNLFNLLIRLPLILAKIFKKKNLILLRGIKFRANGRLRGKLRSNSCVFFVGCHPLQTFKSSISFTKAYIYTRYGAFGFRLWTYRIGVFYN